MPAIHLSPEDITAHRHISRGEKLEWLTDMKNDLELKSRRGKIDPDRYEQELGSIEYAIARVTRGRSNLRKRRHSGDRSSPRPANHP
jgi:hypothetical protein